jgi:hypothetical protein
VFSRQVFQRGSVVLQEAIMIEKCANPGCPQIFRHLHEGKLFAIESHHAQPTVALQTDAEYSGGGHHFHYFWLCPSCCHTMTIRLERGQVVVVQQTSDGQEEITVIGSLSAMKRNKLLIVFKSELDRVRGGKYRNQGGWRVPLYFEDSEVCHRNSDTSCQSSGCVLMDWVPDASRLETVPCRHIVLNQRGETLESMYRTATAEETEAAVRDWLASEIETLETLSEERERNAA